MVITTPKIPVIGETVLGSGFAMFPGGKGANQAVAAARLGGDVTMIGCVCEDFFGKELISNLANNGVNISHIQKTDNCATGVAMIVVKDGDNLIIVDPGANSKLEEQQIQNMELIIAESKMLIIQLEIPQKTVLKAMQLARKHNVQVLLNPAPASKLSDELLALVDICTPNETECEILTGITIKQIKDAEKAVRYLNKKDIPIVIVTMGAKGVVYNQGDKIVHKKATRVRAVDTTGAGDAFSGAIAVALTQGVALADAIDFASMVGAITVTKRGAQASFPSIEEVRAFKAEII